MDCYYTFTSSRMHVRQKVAARAGFLLDIGLSLHTNRHGLSFHNQSFAHQSETMRAAMRLWCVSPEAARERVLASPFAMRSIHQLFGSRLRQIRREQQLGAVDVAALVGCDVSHYYSIERGAHPPSFALLVAIARALEVDEADLFVWPGSGLRHDLREQIRLTPSSSLSELKAAFDTLPSSRKSSRR